MAQSRSPPPSLPPLTPEQKKEDLSGMMYPIFAVFSILPLIAVALRIVSRRVTHMKLWWDDWLLVVACGGALAQLAFLIGATKSGMGRHMQLVSQSDLKSYLIFTFASELYYAIDITLVKCSIICLYLRIFSIRQGFVKVCYGMMAFVLAWFTAIFFSTIFQCTPVQAAWDKSILMAECVDIRLWLIGNNVPNILADFVIILMPLPLVWELKLSLPRKIGLCFTFLLAFTATIISIVRVVVNVTIDTLDVTWGYVDPAILSTVEGDIGIVCACLPVLAPVFRLMSGRSALKTTSASGAGSSGLKSNSKHSALESYSRLDHESDRDALFVAAAGVSRSARPSDDDIALGQIKVTRDVDVSKY